MPNQNNLNKVRYILPLQLDKNSFGNQVLEAHRFIENWDLAFSKATKNIQPYVSPTAIIHPSAIIGENVYIDDDVYIGPNCYLRSNIILFKGVKLGFSVELDRIILSNNVKIAHVTNLGRAIVGKGCNFAYGNVIATKNLVGKIKVHYDHSSYFLSKASHHGCVIGDNVITGVNVSFMPGCSVYPQSKIFPYTMVKGMHK